MLRERGKVQEIHVCLWRVIGWKCGNDLDLAFILIVKVLSRTWGRKCTHMY